MCGLTIWFFELPKDRTLSVPLIKQSSSAIFTSYSPGISPVHIEPNIFLKNCLCNVQNLFFTYSLTVLVLEAYVTAGLIRLKPLLHLDIFLKKFNSLHLLAQTEMYHLSFPISFHCERHKSSHTVANV